jgi:small subunit ribosomal protein S6
MRHYEIVLLISPDQSDQIDAMMTKYRGIVTAQNGTVHRLEDWGRQKLAYPIKKNHKTYHMLHYILVNLECNQQALDELKNGFRYNDAIIRSLVMRADEAETGESIFSVNQKEAIRREKERESRMAFRRSFETPSDELVEIEASENTDDLSQVEVANQVQNVNLENQGAAE